MDPWCESLTSPLMYEHKHVHKVLVWRRYCYIERECMRDLRLGAFRPRVDDTLRPFRHFPSSERVSSTISCEKSRDFMFLWIWSRWSPAQHRGKTQYYSWSCTSDIAPFWFKKSLRREYSKCPKVNENSIETACTAPAQVDHWHSRVIEAEHKRALSLTRICVLKGIFFKVQGSIRKIESCSTNIWDILHVQKEPENIVHIYELNNGEIVNCWVNKCLT